MCEFNVFTKCILKFASIFFDVIVSYQCGNFKKQNKLQQHKVFSGSSIHWCAHDKSNQLTDNIQIYHNDKQNIMQVALSLKLLSFMQQVWSNATSLMFWSRKQLQPKRYH
jgi:hypothetical protein